MIGKIKYLLFGTIRKQLIISVAIVHAVLMALFVWDLTDRQRDLLLERQIDQAEALAKSIATSSAGWVAARDIYGLQEIITAQSRYSELLFAIIIDRDGLILAHSDTSHVGAYIRDMPTTIEPQLLSRTPKLVDAVSPIILADYDIGWVRIGLGQQKTAERLADITRNGIIYAIFAIFIGSGLAWYMGTQLTRKLHAIQTSADAVSQGDTGHRVQLHGTDEVNHVAQAYNQMLDSLATSRQEVEKSKERFDLAMLASNDGLWDWDLETDNIYYSPSWKSMLGYKDNELKNNFKTWEEHVDPDDIPKTMALINACIKGERKNFKVNFKMRHKDGHWIQIKSQGIMVENINHKPVRIVGTHTDITKSKQKEEIIWKQANYDTLTKLPNRKLFSDLLDQEIHRAERTQDKLWLLFLDLDGFKEVNDRFGHHVGDILLKHVANRVQTSMRHSDIIARLGGDEFVIVLSDVNEIADVDRLSTNLIENISQPFELEHDKVFITASIGISCYPEDAVTAQELLKFADQSMYEAKKEGKNRFIYFTPALQHASILRMQISSDLRIAISENQFELYYQPIVDLRSDKIYKAEALIRWPHPEKGMIMPGAFIPIAEETGTICDIGNWIFQNAFKQLESWRKKNNHDLQLSINMSPSQLKVMDLKYDNWLDELQEYQLQGKNIIIEITEGMLLKNEKKVAERLLKYRDSGIQVAIDDFGTGYSSLSYLKEFDIDILKIDRSFIRDMKPGNSEHSLAEAIVVMAHKLHLKVIAEGVETKQQLELLKKMECDYAQGYLYSKPLPAEEFETKFLKDSPIVNKT